MWCHQIHLNICHQKYPSKDKTLYSYVGQSENVIMFSLVCINSNNCLKYILNIILTDHLIMSEVMPILNWWNLWCIEVVNRPINYSINSSPLHDYLTYFFYFHALIHNYHDLTLMIMPWFTLCLLLVQSWL